MAVDGAKVQLGVFDGASAFPSATPLALLALAALAVTAISQSFTRRVAIILVATSSLVALLLTLPQILNQDVSALDGQLDRLTGIANTHGLENVEITSYWFAYAWVALAAACVAFSIWMLRSSATWSNQDRSSDSSKKSSTPSKKQPKTSIDLWDDQRQ